MVIEFACSNCGHGMQVPDEAAGKTGKCKKCSASVKVPGSSPVMPKAQKPAQQPEQTLYHRHPSMFRNRPVLFVFLVLIIPFYGAGLILLILWWLRSLGTTLTVTDKRSTQRSGLFSKSITEIWHRDVRNVLVKQSFFQRIFGVGAIGISSSGGGGVEIQVPGMPKPYKVKEFVDAGR